MVLIPDSWTWERDVQKNATPRRLDAKRLSELSLPAGVYPSVSGIQHRKHGAALGSLANFARSGEQLRLAAAQPVHGDHHELAIERVDQRRALEREGVVGQQMIEARGRGARRRFHPTAHRIGADLFGLRF